MERLRIVFMGTAQLSRASLQALLDWPGCQIVTVVTQPDRRSGRDLQVRPPPVKELALARQLPVLQPERARDEGFIGTVRQLGPDLLVVAAYGQILPQALLDVPRFGSVNVHTSLLPKYRGAAPIQWALLNDEPETGVTIMRMDAGLDTGDILSLERTPLDRTDTAETVHDRLACLGAQLLVRTLPDFVAGKIQGRPQAADQASYAPKIKKEDGRIDWNQSARSIWNRVRGLAPWPGAFTFLPRQPRPDLLKLWHAQVAECSGAPGEVLSAGPEGMVVGCGQQSLRLLQVQREGGRRLAAREFLAGHPVTPGTRLG